MSFGCFFKHINQPQLSTISFFFRSSIKLNLSVAYRKLFATFIVNVSTCCLFVTPAKFIATNTELNQPHSLHIPLISKASDIEKFFPEPLFCEFDLYWEVKTFVRTKLSK